MSDSGGEEDLDDEALADEWAKALSEQDDEESEEVKQAELDELVADAAQMAPAQQAANSVIPVTEGLETEGGPDLSVIMDIPVKISMEVGSTDITIRNLLQLNQGSVIELDRLAGESLDVMVNGTLIAHGEVVVVNEKFGIRLTDIISQAERIKKIN